MDSVAGAGASQATNTVMLKKTLDFQQETVGKLLSGSAQDGGAQSALRTDAMQAQGKGQQLNISV